jgi:glycosyltransferase involved in cell wall biosynthesis
LTLIADSLLSVHNETGARLEVLGSINRTLGDLEAMVDRVPWSESRQHALLGQWDLAIMPLENGDWAKGKCAYKLLQYGAAALPALASPVGANVEVIQGGGVAAPTTTLEWRDGIMDLLRANAADRKAMGESLYYSVGSKYSFNAWSTTWLDAVLGN